MTILADAPRPTSPARDQVRPWILAVDDDQSFSEVMRFHLEEEGYRCHMAANGTEALKLFARHLHPIVITDLKMPGMDGSSLLRELKSQAPETLVIVITAFGDTGMAVQCMKDGAFDFLPKPCSRDHFKLTLERAAAHWSLKHEVRELRDQIDSEGKTLVHRSQSMRRLVLMADRVAASDATVLILGESGTGKELVARRIHRHSLRCNGPFVAINCAAIPRDLLESELFGHVRGAFTGAVRDRKGRFEQATCGTLFLDEIGELPADIQVRLLRVLQERTIDVVGSNEPRSIDVRIVCATNRDLEKAVRDRLFREDLYYRLAVVQLRIPALRERREDILPLVEHFLQRYGPDRSFDLSPDLLARLETRAWRGNVRELENVCQRMVLLSEDGELTVEALSDTEGVPERPRITATDIQLPRDGVSLIDLERDVIVQALERNHYNCSKTAKFLQIPRHILQYRIEKYQIQIHRVRASG